MKIAEYICYRSTQSGATNLLLRDLVLDTSSALWENANITLSNSQSKNTEQNC